MARAYAKSEKMGGEDLPSLNIEEAVSSKSWASRKNGYEALATIFKNLDPRSPQWERLGFLIKAVSEERNVPALEKGLEATLTFVQICANMKDETVDNLLNGVVLRCLADQKVRIRELATQICMVLFEKRKHSLVIEMLLEGLEGRNVKQTFACIRTLNRALTMFGTAMVDVTLITPRVVGLCLNKSMFQQDVKDLFREIYALIGTRIRQYLTTLDASQLKTMDAEFENVDAAKAEKTISGAAASKVSDQLANTPKKPSSARPKSSKISKNQSESPSFGSRPLSSASQSIKKVAERIRSPRADRLGSSTSPGATGKKKEDGGGGDRFSPRNRNNRPNIQSQITGFDDIFMMIESKQWGDRKDALEELMKIINSDRAISHTTYNKIIKCLRILILNDTNVLLISKAVQCVTALAKKEDHQEFKSHAPLMMTLLLEKFKEKKTVLVEAIREAIDAIYSNCSFASIVRYISLSLEHQNPAVKSETELFLWRCFTNPNPEILKAAYWHQLVGNLVKNLSYQDQNVRQNATKALGAMMKAVGEHNLSPLLRNVQRHHQEMISKFANAAIIEFIQPMSSVVNENSDQSVEESDEDDEKVAIIPENAVNVIKVPAKLLRTVYMAEEGATNYSSDDNQQSSNSLCTDEPFYDAQEPSEGSKGRSTTSNTTQNEFFHSISQKPRAKVSQSKDDGSKLSKVKSPMEPEATSKDGTSKKSKKKSLSPEAQQRLDSLRSTIDQLKSVMYSDVRNPRSPTNSAKLNVEHEIAQKLHNLECNVDICFKEIRQLSPLLYDEMAEPESQINGSHTVREFNKRLSRMEGLLKSMTFKETRGNVQAAPPVIRQGNGNWFIEGGY
uniref:TOG domain-containing protein n=1 Tax=Lygus hesperus TaxID=30085 RepID=A0A0A9YTN8_LYGHE